MLFRRTLPCALLITLLAACGGGSSNQNSSASTEPSSSAGAMSAASPGTMQGGNMQAIESRPQAPVPSSLNCGAVQPVWTNPRSHTYFESTAPFYGRTKNGSYMCPSAAVAAGYHKASGRRHHGGGAMEGQPAPAGT
ncbi:MAG TPA: hypothetical protein VK702_02565 [Candidatus Acidoferrum sp.]|nr:hypothetical protein [Candidatus Acidoferrum sp.]